MELISYSPSQNGEGPNHALTIAVNNPKPASSTKPFIDANTTEGTLEDIQRNHIIPVFIKDNEPVISQVDFINTTLQTVHDIFPAERITPPAIRLSHPIKGRVPEAKDKPAKELLEWEKTLYYERMAFIVEVPSISDSMDGQQLSLTIGGIKAHNLDNLYNKKGAEEHFKFFIGFKVSVCTNLCVWSDGYAGDIRVKNLQQLKTAIRQLISTYDAISGLKHMSTLQQYALSEGQFASLIGRCRMYQHLPNNQKKEIPELKFTDTQIAAVCKDYYRDNSFCRTASGDINLWKLYNLFTAANRNTYIDQFLDKGVNASCFVSELAHALEQGSKSWFLS